MKILICLSSGRKNGNTARIVRIFEEALKTEAKADGETLSTETVFLAHSDIRPCLGCRTCFDRGEDKCPQRDDIPRIRERMRKADGVIAASPVYVNDMNGVMKNWIDRLAHACHRPEFAGKSAFLIATTGATSTAATLLNLKVAFWTWGFHVAGQGGFTAGALTDITELRKKYGARIAHLAKRYYRSLKTKQAFRPSFFSLMTFRIQQASWSRKPVETVDGKYWRKSGWTDPRVTFFIPHRAFFLKVLLARLVGSFIALFYA
jgi:multimeric flavodoxin WrbA